LKCFCFDRIICDLTFVLKKFNIPIKLMPGRMNELVYFCRYVTTLCALSDRCPFVTNWGKYVGCDLQPRITTTMFDSQSVRVIPDPTWNTKLSQLCLIHKVLGLSLTLPETPNYHNYMFDSHRVRAIPNPIWNSKLPQNVINKWQANIYH